MNITLANNATSTLAGNINDSVTSLDVAAGEGAKFPALTAGKYYYCTLAQGTNVEIVKVTARSTDTFTVVREQDGSTKAAFTTGAKFEMRLNKAQLLDHTTERILADAAKNLDTYKNYIANPNAVENTTGWTTFADASAAVPADGTGGAPTITWTRNTTTPLNDIADFLFTKDAADRRGEGAAYTCAIDVEDRGKFLGISFNTILASGTYTANDLAVFVYDVTNSALLNNGAAIVMTAPDATTGGIVATALPGAHSGAVLIPATCASVRLLIYETVVNAADYNIQFSNFKFTDNPFAYKNLLATQDIRYQAYAGMGSTNNKIMYFTNAVSNSGTQLLSVTNDSTNGFFVTANVACSVVGMLQIDPKSASASAYGFSWNSTELTTSILSIAAANKLGVIRQVISNIQTVNFNKNLAAGDKIYVHTSGDAPSDSATAMVEIIAFATSENIITPAKSAIEEFLYTGFTSSADATKIKYKTAARNTLSKVASVSNAGNYTVVTALKKCIAMLTSSNLDANAAPVHYVYLYNSAGTLIMTKGGYSNNHGTVAMTTIMNPGDYAYVDVSIDPDDNVETNFGGVFVDFEQQVLSALPAQTTCYIKDVKAQNTPGGTFTSGDEAGTWGRQRDLNVINESGSITTGTCSFATLAANVFTLQPGTYKFKAAASANIVDWHQAALYTGTTVVLVGSVAMSNASHAAISHSIITGTLTVSTPTSYMIRHKCYTTSVNTSGFGIVANFTSEVYTQVEITKIR